MSKETRYVAMALGPFLTFQDFRSMDCKEITFTIAHPFTGKSSGVVIRDMDNRVDVIGAPWMWTHIKRILKECSGLEYHNLVDKIKFIQSDIIRDAIANNNKEQCHL